MIHAYSHIYLNKASRAVGHMLHDAVLEFGYDGELFLGMFIQSGIAEQIEQGNPKYVAGRSGLELFAEVIERATGRREHYALVETYDRSDVYWVGWILAQYQWYSGRSFRDILEVVPYSVLLGFYTTLHEVDVRKAYEVLDAQFLQCESKLKRVRKCCGLTQEQLSEHSGVSLNTIRAYERKAKDIGKAQIETVLALANVLKCEAVDLLD